METTPTVVPEVFTRKSSGLVRTVSAWDTLYYGVMAITIAYVVFTVAAWPNYPGSSMEWATAITTVGALGLGIVYALLAATYPRSGGEYVFLSRTVHPAIGFVVSFVNAVWYTFYFGVNGAFFAIYGLSPLLGMLGLQTHNTTLINLGTWFGQKWGIFIAGSALVLLIGFMVYRGMRAYFLFQRWGGTIALISAVITIVLFALGQAGVLHFARNFDSLAGAGAYAKVLAAAKHAGTPLGWHSQLGPTMNFTIWPAFAIFFSVNMVAFSGEIRNVRFSQFFGIIGSMILSGLLMIGLMYFGRQAVGTRFLLAAASNPNSFPLAVPPFLNIYAAILANNGLMTVIVNLWVIFVIPYALGTNVLYSSRALFAWGIDGMAPEQFTTVSDRYHSPTFSIIVLMALAEIALAIFAFTTWVAILSGLLGFCLGFIVVSLTGLLFPYVKRQAYRGSPAAIQVAGAPLITFAGVISTLFVAFLIYRAFVDKTYGANTTISLVANGVVVALGVIWFYGMRAYRKSRGVNVDRRYQEIPVE